MAKNKLHFYFKPASDTQGGHTVEKEEEVDVSSLPKSAHKILNITGKEKTVKIKRRYFRGISSGEGVDAQKQRMSARCIKGFQSQHETKEILLHPSPHGLKDGDDYGRLVKSQILENGDWETWYQIYDGSEGAQPYQVERANAMWARANGLPPYTRKTEYGFSIEGIIPDDGIIKDASNGVDILDYVDLDGVISTTRPAYTASYSEPIYKALGIQSPQKVKKQILGSLRDKIKEERAERDYWKNSWELRDALDEAVKQTMQSSAFLDDNDRREQLELIFDEYKVLMLDLIFSSPSVFSEDDDGSESVAMMDTYGKGNKKVNKSNERKKSGERERLMADLQNDLGQTLGAFADKLNAL